MWSHQVCMESLKQIKRTTTDAIVACYIFLYIQWQTFTLKSVDLGCGQIYVFCEPSMRQKHIPRVMIIQPRHLLRTKSRKTFLRAEIERAIGSGERWKLIQSRRIWEREQLDYSFVRHVRRHGIYSRDISSAFRRNKILLLADHVCWQRAALMALPKLSWINVVWCPACEVCVEVWHVPSQLSVGRGSPSKQVSLTCA